MKLLRWMIFSVIVALTPLWLNAVIFLTKNKTISEVPVATDFDRYRSGCHWGSDCDRLRQEVSENLRRRKLYGFSPVCGFVVLSEFRFEGHWSANQC